MSGEHTRPGLKAIPGGKKQGNTARSSTQNVRDGKETKEAAEKISRLVSMLRREGIQVSTSEAIDATAALILHESPDPRLLEQTLACTLLKRHEDRLPFIRVFLEWWRQEGSPTAGTLDQPQIVASFLQYGEQGIDRVIRETVAANSGAGLVGGARGVERWLQMRSLTDEVAKRFQLTDITTQVEGELKEHGIHSQVATHFAKLTLQEAARHWEQTIREEVAYQWRRNRSDRNEETERTAVDLSELAFADADPSQLIAMRRIIPALAHKIAYEKAYRTTRQTGHLLFRKTIRKNMGHGGIPVNLLFRKQVRKRQQIVLLCDLSRSVETFSVFGLLMAYAMRELFQRVQCFAFVSDVADVTKHLQQHDFGAFFSSIHAKTEMTSRGVQTDYGVVFRHFADRYASSLPTSATLIVLGDGRNNERDPGMDSVKYIRNRVKRMYWLNPEPEMSWGMGDSVMDGYRPYFHKAVHCGSLKQLGEFIADLRM